MSIIRLSLLLCIIFFMSGVSSCIEKERQALLEFKANLSDPHGDLDDWGSKDCCNWAGVTCDSHTGHVVNLKLGSEGYDMVGYTGNFSSSIQALHELQDLELYNFDFQSNPLPDSLGSLSKLEYLYIPNANLSGPVSHQLANLSNLRYVVLRNNSLNGSLPDFIGCPYVRHLDMSGNQLSGNVPTSLGGLSNLEFLDFSSNSLEGVISDAHFLNLTQLNYLDLSFNSLALNLSFNETVPFQLIFINLQSCKLGPTFPMWIKTQRNIQRLDISNAGISDVLPSWFADISVRLNFMSLSSNEIKGMLPNISHSEAYGYLGMDLSYNHFEGKVPLLPSNMTALNLAGNRFSGTLSFLCEIGELLTFLDLSNNSFSGSLPDCWLKFRGMLLVLNLSNNKLSGKIPSSLGFLSRIEALYLRTNAFIGEVPMSLSNCTRLRFLDLWGNKLSGIIPQWIGEELSKLYVLDLGSNRFYGRLPSEVCRLYNLQVLDLSNNGLSGNIPGCFDNFTAMASKSFTSDMDQSYSFHIGSIYDECGLHFKCLTGEIVSTQFSDSAWVTWKGTERSFRRSGLQLLRSIDLSRNNLSGKVPREITSLYELVSLNLSFNKLHGEVPKDMGRLKSLESLDLARNEFTGHIPGSLAQLNFLSYLDLTFNNLSGSIPTGSQLQRFDYTSYAGNPQLCGPPLTPRCGSSPFVEKKVVEEDEDDSWKSHYTGMGAGFAVGFLGICGALIINRRCRYIFFVSLSYIKDWIYVTAVVHFRKLERKLRR